MAHKRGGVNLHKGGAIAPQTTEEFPVGIRRFGPRPVFWPGAAAGRVSSESIIGKSHDRVLQREGEDSSIVFRKIRLMFYSIMSSGQGGSFAGAGLGPTADEHKLPELD